MPDHIGNRRKSATWQGFNRCADSIAKGKADTRHYSKRQFTFIRHQLPEFVWAAPEEGEQAINAMFDF